MTRNVSSYQSTAVLLTACFAISHSVQAAGTAENAVAAARSNNQFSFIMFYRSNNAATQSMYRVLTSTLADRKDAIIAPVQITNNDESALIKQFDATRIPMPAVAVLAPNGAVCSVLPLKVSEQQLVACIVSSAQAKCLKALQDNKIVALCAQPSADAEIPVGVKQFRSDELYANRTVVISVLAADPAETKFLNQLRVPTDKRSPVVAFMAPPGVMIGVFDGQISHGELAAKLAAAGKCCDDENCKHHKAAAAKQPTRR